MIFVNDVTVSYTFNELITSFVSWARVYENSCRAKDNLIDPVRNVQGLYTKGQSSPKFSAPCKQLLEILIVGNILKYSKI